MKNIKSFEKFIDIEVGDIVIAIDTLPKNKNGYDLIEGEKYKILSIEFGYCSVEDMKGNYKGNYLLARFLPELEYFTNKYNL